MRNLDFSSWQGLLSTLVGLAVITLIGVGIRLLAMQTVQQRRERENRQINERLRTLIAAYRTLGGSFTGELSVAPTHLRDLRRRDAATASDTGSGADGGDVGDADAPGFTSDRSRRIRDAVQAALSDILLLGTDEQVRLAAQAASELVAGRRVHVAALVVSLRDFIRDVLGLDPIPAGLAIPQQGPTRPGASRGGRGEGGAREERAGRGGGRGGGGAGLAGGMGLGVGAHLAADPHDPASEPHGA
jgi:hypothetical protein